MPFDGRFLEIRSTDDEVFDHLDLVEDPGSDVYESAFSFVLPKKGGSGPRRLPSLYMGATLFFADRRLERVADQFRLITSFARRSMKEAVYTLQAVRIGDAYGLYARDFFNRSVYRRRLQRQGAELSASPVVLFEEGSFSTPDWGAFEADFAVFGDHSPDDPTPYTLKPGEVAFALMTYRIGQPSPQELTHMLRVASRVLPLAKEDATEVVTRVKARGEPPL